MKELVLQTTNCETISAHVFLPKHSNNKVIVVNGATGVPQRMYFSFAQYASNLGFMVFTYDYQGIGNSKKGNTSKCKASMKDWGSYDFKAVTDYIFSHYPTFEMYAIGHSIGALILGMNEASEKFSKYVFFATQNAFVGNLNLKIRLFSYLGFGIIRPFSTQILRYFPAKVLGLGEDLPSECAKDWGKIILKKQSINNLLKQNSVNVSKKMRQDVLILRADDDEWVTEKGEKTLMKYTYPNMNPHYKVLKSSMSSQNEIGHINFFRKYNSNLWNYALDFFNN